MKEITLDEHVNDIVKKRKVRRRSEGDGGGVDLGIEPGAYHVTLERYIEDLSADTKKRLLEHVKHHTDEALKPLVRLMERAGADEDKIRLFRDIGPNCLRTVIEHLEAEGND